MPDLARKSARRIQRAQERMQAAVMAAEVESSETFSGRSTEDTEVCYSPMSFHYSGFSPALFMCVWRHVFLWARLHY